MDKRQLLIETAFRLFYEQGVHAVGINQILKEAGVAKKTLYHHFTSKEELVAAVVTYRDEKFINWFGGRMAAAEPGIPALEAMFAALHDWFNNRVPQLIDFHGCFFINVCGEFSDPAHPVHQQCSAHKSRVIALIREQVAQLEDIKEGEIDSLTQSLALLKEGAIVLAHVQGDKRAAQQAGESSRQLLKSYR